MPMTHEKWETDKERRRLTLNRRVKELAKRPHMNHWEQLAEEFFRKLEARP